MSKKRLLSGIKPTGELHIGNYFGAMKQFVDLQNENESHIFVADYHALNFIQNAEEMQQRILDVTRGYLAIGLDPAKSVLFKQSDITEHTELAWVFDTITTMPYLMRAHAYKDAEAKGKEVSVGTFNYPMLMAADILLYSPDIVPVGQDQKQHVEYARDTAEKFNRIYGDAFTLPEPMILEEVAVVPGTDGQKMSKSYGNVIPLFGSREEIQKAVMGIVTDSGTAGEISSTRYGDTRVREITWAENVFKIHSLFKSEDELWPLYIENRDNYKALKEALTEDIDANIKPLREKHASISDEDVKKVLEEGAKQAKEIASKKMETVRKLIGVTL